MGWRCFLGAGLWLIHFGLCLDEVGPVRDSSPWSSLRTWFPGSHSQVGVASSGPWVSPGGRGRSRALPALQPVAVQCQGDSMVVTVQRDLFGTGRLVLPGDLWLGAAFCSYTSVSVDNTVIFQTALHDCGNTKEVTPKLVIYSSILTYMPTPSSNRVITRTNQMSVLLQCIYPRHANVSSKAIKPTWVPLRTTVFADGMLSFSFRLMTDDWTSSRSTTTFQLGDVFHLEASVDAASHYPLRIYVDSCMASPTVDPDSTLQYDIVSSHGCLVDGKMSESSAFVSPRVQPDKLRFTVDAFRFIGTTNSLIFITCSLRAVPADSAPSPVSKACSYQARRGWSPVEGPSSVCGCCDSGSCASLGGPRALHQDSAPRRFGKRGEPTDEFQVLAVGPLIVLSENDAAGADVPPPDILALSDGEPRSMLGLEPQFLASEVAQEDEHHHIQDRTVDFEMEGRGPLRL
ncbi:zona pellucida sperm-binding protein 3-like [Pleurodeles waltl]|uniref:zona pellucida sperm-binding protein 3-like n=1 Tax=Pleurodeles waltl TaxID=8319 RepID=UPI0037099A11